MRQFLAWFLRALVITLRTAKQQVVPLAFNSNEWPQLYETLNAFKVLVVVGHSESKSAYIDAEHLVQIYLLGVRGRQHTMTKALIYPSISVSCLTWIFL